MLAYTLFSFLSPILLQGCGEDEAPKIRELLPIIVTDQEEIDFGNVIVLYDDTEELTIINPGLADLRLTNLSFSSNPDEVFELITDPSYLNEEGELVIPQDESMSVTLGFDPVTYIPYAGELLIESNDPETPQVTIPLKGEGVDGPVPDIRINPQLLDFGLVNQGLTQTLFFQVENVGTGTLLIGDVTIDGSSNFSLVSSFANTEHQIGSSITVIVNYTPTEESGDNATLRINSNDPDESTVELVMLGNGGGQFDYPVAEFDCPSEIDPPRTWTFDGSPSYDPNGYEPLTYQWELLGKPDNSTTKFDNDNANIVPLFIDTSGEYKVQLKVTNSIGLESEPKDCTFNAIPDESLHVELSWNTDESDVDIHLVQFDSDCDAPNGKFDNYGLFSLKDCHFNYESLYWGDPDSVLDDPSLSLDNRIGYGPEVIHIPKPADSTYGIFVHFWSDRDSTDGLTTATVKLYINNELYLTRAHAFQNTSDMWMVGQIDWANGDFNGFYETEIVPGENPLSYNGATICEAQEED